VAPSIVIGVVATAITTPASASGFLGTYGILGLIIMYLMANVALVVEWAKFRARGIHKNIWLWVVVPVIGVAVLAVRSGATCGLASRARTTSCRG
jgi:amino acid transporter